MRGTPTSLRGCPARRGTGNANSARPVQPWSVISAAMAGVRLVGASRMGRKGVHVTRRKKGALFFLLCCRCCQALLRIFFSLHSILLRRCVTWPRSRWRLPVALGPRVSNDLLSVRVPTPVTRCSLRLSTTAGRPVGGDPIYTTASLQGPEK
jgi:hypothetical protein